MIVLLLIPALTGLFCYCLRERKAVAYLNLAGMVLLNILGFPVVFTAISEPLQLFNQTLYMDALSAYIIGLILFLGLASSIYSIDYLEHEFAAGITDEKNIRRYYLLFNYFIFSMLLVALSNNLALMWIAIEATTIVSAPLIGLGFYKRELAIEAAWKYIILCTVGITFALLGTFITYYASTGVNNGAGSLNWTSLKAVAGALNGSTMKLAFIFILVGYGTKAGLAPLHNWLPDAHSQAPSPISALLSGILLNTAFYGILRFVAIVEPSTGKAFTANLLLIFGLLSMGLSAVFILVQNNYKRLLAYSSIEHMGIIAIGTGIGGFFGLYGSLLHILNHALAKPLLFYTSGKLQSRYGSTGIENVRGVFTSMPLLGMLTFMAALSLAGTPPFSIFISEFTILRAAADQGSWITAGLFLFFVIIVFYGVLSAFGRMMFGEQPEHISVHDSTHTRADRLSYCLMVFMAVMTLVLGFWIPDFIDEAIRNSIALLGVS